MKFKEQPEDYCPACLTRFNSSGTFGENTPPAPGDLSICYRCGTIMAFNDQLKLEKATEDQWAATNAVTRLTFSMLNKQIVEA